MTRRDGLERREALLDAALACFVAGGVAHTGIEAIRKAAGASPSSVYHHFGGLPELTLALLERTFARLFAELAARVVPCADAQRAVLALVRAHLDWVFAHRDEATFMYQATALEIDPSAAQRLLERKAELLAPVATHFAAFVRRRELPNLSPLQFDVVLLGPTHEACRRWLAGAALDPAWMRRTLPRLAWQSIAAR